MPNPARELAFLVKAYDQYVIELGDERAENVVRLVFALDRAQQIIDAHATERAVAQSGGPQIVVDFDANELTCPHCSAVDSIVEVDQCARRNELRAADDHIAVDLEDELFEHQRYECDACGRRVFVPGSVDVSSVS